MVVASFLQKHQQYVSFARGGYFCKKRGGGSREGAPVFFRQLSGRGGPVRSNGCDQLSTETSTSMSALPVEDIFVCRGGGDSR